MEFDLTHARHDPATCLAPGLFRSLKRGDRKRLKLDVSYDYGKGERLEFKGPEPLGAEDLRVLQGLIAMAGPGGLVLKPDPQTEAGAQLRLLLETKFDAVEQNALVVKDSYRRLAREIGYDPDHSTTFRTIRECVERLYTVTVFAQAGKRRQSYHMLSHYDSDEADGRLFVALNPRITEAVLGARPHTRIELSEVRALAGDVARLIHQRLSAWIDPGKVGRAEIDTLAGYVWPDPANAITMRKRRERVREALAEVKATGWGITEYARGKYDIRRPGKPVSRTATPRLNCHAPPP